jgi:8-oxo-dGTP pyrophosphatase MutT (NUDIX family)
MLHVVQAAGGIVWRGDKNGPAEIVLVHRPAYDDWTFPKGKLHPGESEEEAALREVVEETGLLCQLRADLGTTSYHDSRGRPKVVRYWEMTAVSGSLSPANEIDDARWVPLGAADDLLTYDRDLELLTRFRAVAAA